MAGQRGRRGRRASSGDELRGRRAEALSQRTERRPGGSPGVRPPSGVPAPCGSRTGLGTRPRFWGPGPGLLLQHFRSACLAGRAEAGKGTWGNVRNGQLNGAEGCPCEFPRQGRADPESPANRDGAVSWAGVWRVTGNEGRRGSRLGKAVPRSGRGRRCSEKRNRAEQCSRENSFSGGMLCRFKRGV